MSDPRRGYTLIELMVVVAILGVMCASSVDLVRGIVAPEMRQQSELGHAVDQQRLLAQLREDLDHAADVTAIPGGAVDPGVLVSSAFRSRPDVRYVHTPAGLVRLAGGRSTKYAGWRLDDLERDRGQGCFLVSIAVKPARSRGYEVLVSRLIFPGGAR